MECFRVYKYEQRLSAFNCFASRVLFYHVVTIKKVTVEDLDYLTLHCLKVCVVKSVDKNILKISELFDLDTFRPHWTISQFNISEC